jgi:putative ABC transport system permease protein
MRALSMAWRSTVRDWHRGESRLLVAALVVAVAATTSVGFFVDRISKVMRAQAGEVLAADLRLESRSPLPDRYREAGRARGLTDTDLIIFASVAVAGDATALVAVRGVGEGYPFRGQHRVSDELFGVQTLTTERPAPGEAWLAPRLIVSLGLEVGDSISLGESEFRVGRILDQAPDQGFRFVDIAPPVLVRYEAIAATGLVGPASRVRHVLLFAGEQDAAQDLADWLEDELLPTEDLDTLAGTQPSLARALDRAERFLGLASLISVLLSGVAVAMATRRHVQRHLDAVALMKCMGASQAFILNLFLSQLAMIALFGAVIGATLGYLGQEVLVALVSDIIGAPLPAAGLRPALLGLVTALVVLAGFAAAPVIRLRKVPPARVLRRDLGGPDLAASTVLVAALAAVAALLMLQVRDLTLFLWAVGALLGTAAILALMAALGLLFLRGLRSRGGTAWRYGLANLVRRRGDTAAQLMAFGLGLSVLVLLALVRTDILDNWRDRFPADTPNQFLINIQPDEVDGVRALLEAEGLAVPRMYPMVRARITEVNGVAADEWAESHAAARWFLHREANLTWAPELQERNRIVEGSWWPEVYQVAPTSVSIEEGIARDLGVTLGDAFAFNVGGEPLTVSVTSTREVVWDSFRPNFFMVMPPGLLDDYPATWVTSVHSTGDDRSAMVRLVRAYPSVTVIDIDAILSQIRAVIDRASLAVEFVFGFTLLAGLMVLLAAVRTTRDQRMQESAMLRTLGASRRLILAALSTEYAVLGVTAGLLGALTAAGTAWLLAVQVFELPFQLDPLLPLIGAGAGAAFILAAGLLATRRVVDAPPAQTLRGAA